MGSTRPCQANPEVIAVSCPFCMTMLTDGIKAKDLARHALDVMEIVRRPCLRRTYAGPLVMNGVYLRTVKELMGHQSYEMTLRYSHVAPAHTLDAVPRLCRTAGDANRQHYRHRLRAGSPASAIAFARARSTSLLTLPDGTRGSSSMMTRCSGHF
jgi:Phage integrase family